jgi:uncharacterized protein (DUF1778 family)
MEHRPRISIRLDSKAELERITKAARVRKWTLNQFILEAARTEAAKIASQTAADNQLAGVQQ